MWFDCSPIVLFAECDVVHLLFNTAVVTVSFSVALFMDMAQKETKSKGNKKRCG